MKVSLIVLLLVNCATAQNLEPTGSSAIKTVLSPTKTTQLLTTEPHGIDIGGATAQHRDGNRELPTRHAGTGSGRFKIPINSVQDRRRLVSHLVNSGQDRSRFIQHPVNPALRINKRPVSSVQGGSGSVKLPGRSAQVGNRNGNFRYPTNDGRNVKVASHIADDRIPTIGLTEGTRSGMSYQDDANVHHQPVVFDVLDHGYQKPEMLAEIANFGTGFAVAHRETKFSPVTYGYGNGMRQTGFQNSGFGTVSNNFDNPRSVTGRHGGGVAGSSSGFLGHNNGHNFIAEIRNFGRNKFGTEIVDRSLHRPSNPSLPSTGHLFKTDNLHIGVPVASRPVFKPHKYDNNGHSPLTLVNRIGRKNLDLGANVNEGVFNPGNSIHANVGNVVVGANRDQRPGVQINSPGGGIHTSGNAHVQFGHVSNSFPGSQVHFPSMQGTGRRFGHSMFSGNHVVPHAALKFPPGPTEIHDSFRNDPFFDRRYGSSQGGNGVISQKPSAGKPIDVRSTVKPAEPNQPQVSG